MCNVRVGARFLGRSDLTNHEEVVKALQGTCKETCKDSDRQTEGQIQLIQRINTGHMVPLDRPPGSSMTSALTTVPQGLKKSLRSCHFT
jgi:hypothetical protein